MTNRSRQSTCQHGARWRRAEPPHRHRLPRHRQHDHTCKATKIAAERSHLQMIEVRTGRALNCRQLGRRWVSSGLMLRRFALTFYPSASILLSQTPSPTFAPTSQARPSAPHAWTLCSDVHESKPPPCLINFRVRVRAPTSPTLGGCVLATHKLTCCCPESHATTLKFSPVANDSICGRPPSVW